jgi:hypothetical protein
MGRKLPVDKPLRVLYNDGSLNFYLASATLPFQQVANGADLHYREQKQLLNRN